jgi:glycosyltransferase involved in cell wall biosynthesis
VNRPRLLFLGPILPYPPDRGVALRSHHVIRHLAERYDLDLLLFRRRGDPTQMPLDHRVAHLRAYGSVEVFDVPADSSSLRRGLDWARSLLLRRSDTRWRYDSKTFRRRTLELVFERDPRLVHVDGMVLHGHLPLLAGRRVVIAHPRPEGEYLRERAELDGGVGSSYLERQADWMAEAERRWMPAVTANVVTSESDRRVLAARAPDARIEIVPTAVDTRHFSPVPGTGHGLAFVGGATAPANRDALDFFAREILPRLRSRSGVQALEPISWIGSARPGDRDRYREVGIDITGYVEDVRPIVRPAACYVVPRRVAGGATRILQAWALGKAVVSTAAGCAGLEAVDGVNVLIRDDAESFARAVLDVLQNAELRQRLGRAARQTVEERYNWESTGRRLRSLYESFEDGPPLRVSEGGHHSAAQGPPASLTEKVS